jgi:SAM-dependent methyltransferase
MALGSVSFDPDTLERLVPDELTSDEVSRATLELHLDRYRFAARHCRPGRVLDIACGVGYGSRLLGDLRRDDVSVLGVDLSEDAVRYAGEHYGDARVSFRQSDAMAFRSDEPFDTIVSLETIEHLPDPAGFVDNILRLLRPGGMFVASVPTTPSVDANPHHLHDFTRRKLDRLVAKHGLREVAALPQVQPFGLRSVLTRADSRTKNVRSNLPSYYLSHPGRLLKRLASTLRHGFANHYITVAWTSPDAERSRD